MTLKLLSKDEIIAIHAHILENDQGFNPENYNTDKLDGVLGRIENIIVYTDESIDPFELAAIYAEAFARGHSFPDGNKRTAFVSAVTVLMINADLPFGDKNSYIQNTKALQAHSFMTEFMVLVAEGKLEREQITQTFMKLYAGTMIVVGLGYGLYKLIDFLVDTFSSNK